MKTPTLFPISLFLLGSAFSAPSHTSIEQSLLLLMSEQGYDLQVTVSNEFDMTVNPWRVKALYRIKVSPPDNRSGVSWEASGETLDHAVRDFLRRLVIYLATAGEYLPPDTPASYNRGKAGKADKGLKSP